MDEGLAERLCGPTPQLPRLIDQTARRHTTFPTTHESSTEELSCQALHRFGALIKEVVELRDQLGEVTERKDAAIDGPRRAVVVLGTFVATE